MFALEGGAVSVTTLSEVDAAVAAVAEGKFVVVLDDVDREDEADLIMAADHVTPEALAFMARHTEAAVDLARLAGRAPAGVLCELVNDDGTMARGEQAARFAAEHGLRILTVGQLIAFRRRWEKLVEQRSSTVIETPYGPFLMYTYE